MTPLEKATKTAEGVVVNGLFFPRWLNSALAVTARRFEGEQFCSSYPVPAKKWAAGRCLPLM